MKASDLTSDHIGKRVRVTMEGTVKAIDHPLLIGIELDGGTTLRLPAFADVEIIPTPPKVGDRVWVRGCELSDLQATIVAIDGDTAWIKGDSGARASVGLSKLTP